MPGNQDAPPARVDDVTSDLTDGLESCKAIMRDYRAKLSAEPSETETDIPAEENIPDSA